MNLFKQICNSIEKEAQSTADKEDYITIEDKNDVSITVFDFMDVEETNRFFTIRNPKHINREYLDSILRISDCVKDSSVDLDREKMLDYLDKEVDKDMLMTVQRIVFVTGDEEDEDSLYKDKLISEAQFEAGHDLPFDNLYGVRWWDYDVVVTNIKALKEELDSVGIPDNSMEEKLNEGVMVTMLHEIRHCAQANRFLPASVLKPVSYDSEVDAEEYAQGFYERHPADIIKIKEKKHVVTAEEKKPRTVEVQLKPSLLSKLVLKER